MIKEVCVENFTYVPLMISRGADRIELNNDLASGGTTPSFGVIKKTVEYAHAYDVSVVVMIRPRSGNFVYNADELEIMVNEIQICSLLDADGVAFGCLNQKNYLDKVAMKKLISVSHTGNLDVIMHMAFDDIVPNEQSSVIDWLADNGVTRVLTHGGQLSKPILACIPHLNEIAEKSKGKIEILPGGGITDKNVNEVLSKTELNQAHGTKILGKY